MTANRNGVSFGADKDVLKLDSGDEYTSQGPQCAHDIGVFYGV